MIDPPGPATASHQRPRSDGTGTRHWVRSPVVFWAGLGVLFLVVEIWVLARWALTGGLHPVPARDEISPGRTTTFWVCQILIAVVLLGSAWYVTRQSRKQGRVSAFAALFAGGATAFWLDPLYNFQQHVRVLPTHVLNVSTWGPSIPGWHGPAPEHQAENAVMSSGLVYGLVFWWIVLTLLVIRYTARKRPNWGPIRLAMVGAAAAAIIDLLIEIPFLQTGGYSWGISTNLGLFTGHWYQGPVFDNIIWGVVVCMPPAMMCHLASRKGTDVRFLRGSDRVVPRLLAGVGLAQLTLMVNIAAIALTASLFAGGQPADTPGYLRLTSGEPHSTSQHLSLTPR